VKKNITLVKKSYVFYFSSRHESFENNGNDLFACTGFHFNVEQPHANCLMFFT